MFENNKILILGMARSGYEAAKVLINRGNEVILNDSKNESEHNYEHMQELKNLGVKLVFGSHPDDLLDETFDYLIKNPGVPINHKYVLKANELSIPVINEVEMAYQLFKGKVKLIGVTGTNGKTTTTTLIYEVLKAADKRIHLTGNIGYPICGFLDSFEENDIVIMEVSAQQLENLNEFKPDIAVMTNLSPAHTDFFGNYENYKKVKAKIFNKQTQEDLAILNYDDPDILKILPSIKSEVKYFSSQKMYSDCYLKNNAIYYHKEKVCDLDKIKITGTHNYENIMAMILVVKELGIPNDLIANVLESFKGVEHRLEYVDNINGRIFYNDSKATNIESTKTALKSFNKPTILIMGGQDRDQEFSDLNAYLKNVRLVVCYGENKQKIKKWLDNLGIYCYECENIIEATNLAYKKSKIDEVILLSPASASWDQFSSFEKRGELFKETINKIE